MALTQTQLEQIYIAYFGRPADVQGVQFYSGGNASTTQVTATFVTSAEYQALFGNLSASQLVNALYQNLFNRDAEPAGLAYWTQLLASGGTSPAQLALSISGGAQGADAQALANKVAIADSFTTLLGGSQQLTAGFSGSNAAALARAFLHTVDATATSVTSATSGLPAAVNAAAGISQGGGGGGGAPAPVTYTLVAGADNVAGASTDDTINGTVVFTNSAGPVNTGTYEAGDTINGGGGNDTLNLTFTGGGNSYTTGALPVATVSGVETINLRATQAETSDIVTVDAANFVGATTINADRSTSRITISNLANSQAVSVIGDGATTNGTLAFGYATSTNPVTINLSGGTLGAKVAGSGSGNVTTATINSTGAANTATTLALNGALSVTSLTINAAANLTASNAISGLDAANATITISGAAASVNLGAITVANIDASGLTTGGLTATLDNHPGGPGSGSTGSVFLTLKGGQGNDIITTGSLATTTASAIDAGAGTADKLIIGASTDVDTLVETRVYAHFEVLESATATVYANQFANSTFTSIRMTGASAVFNDLNATQAANVTITASTAGTLALSNGTDTGASDTVKASVANSSSSGVATAIDLTGLTLPNIEILELTGNGTTSGNSGAITFTTTNATALSSIKLTTAGTGSITIAGGHTASGLVVDGSASSGALTLNATAYNVAGGDTLKGGTGNDTLIGSSTQHDTLTGGSGNDNFVFALGVQDASKADSITDLNLGTGAVGGQIDKITFNTPGDSTAITIAPLGAGVLGTIAASADITAAATAVAALVDGMHNLAQFTWGGDTYLYFNGHGTSTFDATTDQVIKITGVTGTLDASDIVVVG